MSPGSQDLTSYTVKLNWHHTLTKNHDLKPESPHHSPSSKQHSINTFSKYPSVQKGTGVSPLIAPLVLIPSRTPPPPPPHRRKIRIDDHIQSYVVSLKGVGGRHTFQVWNTISPNQDASPLDLTGHHLRQILTLNFSVQRESTGGDSQLEAIQIRVRL